jgi:hypothetical protein
MNQSSGGCALQRRNYTDGPLTPTEVVLYSAATRALVIPTPVPRSQFLGEPETWLVESWSGSKTAVSRLGDVRRAIG